MPEQRFRSCMCIVYPDSAPADWKDRLCDMHIPAAVSPLHDKDVNPDGEIKKAHWHVVLNFDGVKSLRQLVDIASQFGGVRVVPCQSVVGALRYLCHIDNPEKAPYPVKDVVTFGGLDYRDYIERPSDVERTLEDVQKWIVSHHCYSFVALSEYCRRYRRDWYHLITQKNTVFLTEFIKSFAYVERTGLHDGTVDAVVQQWIDQDAGSDDV